MKQYSTNLYLNNGRCRNNDLLYIDLYKCIKFWLFSQLKVNEVPVGKLYETIVNSKCWKGDTTTSEFLDHQYESICSNYDPIYEEINEKPPPLPISSPPGNLL